MLVLPKKRCVFSRQTFTTAVYPPEELELKSQMKTIVRTLFHIIIRCLKQRMSPENIMCDFGLSGLYLLYFI